MAILSVRGQFGAPNCPGFSPLPVLLFMAAAPPDVGLADAEDTRAAAWGDYDGAGDEETVDGPAWTFADVAEESGVGDPRRTVGVVWFDFDRDGDLDLAIANNHETGGTHHLYRNMLPAGAAARSLQVAATDREGWTVVPGAEIQLLDHDGGRILGTRVVDSGGGYCSQGATPAHFGIPPGVERVDVRVTYVAGGRRATVVREGVLPSDYQGRWLIVRQGQG